MRSLGENHTKLYLNELSITKTKELFEMNTSELRKLTDNKTLQIKEEFLQFAIYTRQLL